MDDTRHRRRRHRRYRKIQTVELPDFSLPEPATPALRTHDSMNFWLFDASALYQSFDITPHEYMTHTERLNAMARLIIIIAAVLYILGLAIWWIVLIMGLTVTVILWYVVHDIDMQHAQTMQYALRNTLVHMPEDMQ